MLNKYANIMTALHPTGTYGDDLFDRIMASAVISAHENPLSPLNKAEVQKQKDWLYDAMKRLIVKVLNRDATLPFTVAVELQKDLDQLIASWGNGDANNNEDIAQDIVDKSEELISGMVNSTQHLGDGFKALARLSAFKSAAIVNKGIRRQQASDKPAVHS
jgi:hypothetical protein